jgi:hypothetical protein
LRKRRSGRASARRRVAVEIGLGLRVAADARVVEVPGRVMADVEVEVAVAVQVGQCRRAGPIAPAAQPTRIRRVLEGAVAAVPVEGIRSPTSDEHVGVAVPVDVAHGHAVPVSGGKSADPRAVGHVLKGAVAAIVKQAIPRLRSR